MEIETRFEARALGHSDTQRPGIEGDPAKRRDRGNLKWRGKQWGGVLEAK